MQEDSRVRGRKSISQIREQQERLTRLARGNNARVDLINRIASKYVTNIAATQRFANDIYGGRGLDVARGRGYSQNTYMGINAG